MQEQDTHRQPPRPSWIIGPATRYGSEVLIADAGLFEGKIWGELWQGIKEIDGIPNLYFGELKHLVEEEPIHKSFPVAHVFGMVTNATYACRCAGIIPQDKELDYETFEQRTAYDLLIFGELGSNESWLYEAIEEVTSRHLPGRILDDDFLPFIEPLQAAYQEYKRKTDLERVQALALRLVLESNKTYASPAFTDSLFSRVAEERRTPTDKQEQTENRNESITLPSDSSDSPISHPTVKLRWQKRTVDLALVLYALYSTGCIVAVSERQLWEAAAHHFDFDTTAKDPAEALRQAYQQVRKGDAGKKTMDPNRLGEFIRECHEAIPVLSAIVGAIDSDSQQDTAP